MTIKYMLLGLLPLHACAFYLFLTLQNKYHEVHLDNLYRSIKFAHLLYTHKNCVKVQGVCLTDGQVIPRGVLYNGFIKHAKCMKPNQLWYLMLTFCLSI